MKRKTLADVEKAAFKAYAPGKVQTREYHKFRNETVGIGELRLYEMTCAYQLGWDKAKRSESK